MKPSAASTSTAVARASLITVTLLACLVVMEAAHAAPRPESAEHITLTQARREITQLYLMLDAAYGKRDSEKQLSLYSPSFVAIDQNGRKTAFAAISSVVKSQCARDLAIQREKGRVLRCMMRTTPKSISVQGSRAAVQWSGHAEALSMNGGAWGHVAQDSTGEDVLVRTRLGWRFERGRLFTQNTHDAGGLTPAGLLAVQKVFQAKQLFDQVILNERASDEQQQQIRIEQNQHDLQVWRQKHGD